MGSRSVGGKKRPCRHVPFLIEMHGQNQLVLQDVSNRAYKC